MPRVVLKLFTGKGTGWIDGRTDKAAKILFRWKIRAQLNLNLTMYLGAATGQVIS